MAQSGERRNRPFGQGHVRYRCLHQNRWAPSESMGRIGILGADDSEFKWEAIPPPLRSSIMGMSILRERGSIRAHGMGAAACMCWQMKNDRVNVQKMECCGDWARTSYRYGSKMNPPRPGD